MGSKGSNQTTTQQQQTYNPAGAAQIQSALTQGQNAAQLPFNLPQAPVAGFSQDQQNAFQNVNNAQGMAQPYYNQAQNLFNQSAQGPNISQFFNPYASAVTAQMNNVFGQQASQNTGQLTQAAGGIGADRIAVGQSELANQQGLAAGQTMASLYAPSLQAAQQQQNIQQGAAYGQASLGSAAQNAALSGAQAQLGTGGLQQQLSQAQMNSPYQLQLAQAAFPYQQAQFGAGITGALAPGLGGTTSGYGTTTSPAPSMLSQILGLGTAGLGAAGGLGAFNSQSGTNPKGSSPSYGGGNMWSGDAYGGSASNPTAGLTAGDYGASGGRVAYAEGGATNPYSLPSGFNDKPINVDTESLIPTGQTPSIKPNVPQLNLNPPAASSGSGGGAGQAIGDAIKIAGMFMKKGGKVDPKKFDGANPYAFADGGTADDDDSSPATFDERFPYRMASQEGMDNWRKGAPEDAAMAFSGDAGAQTAFPPPSGAHGRSGNARAAAAAQDAAEDLNPASTIAAGPQEAGSRRDSGFAGSPWAALMAAGLGIASGTSPFAGVNIGRGAMEGLKTLESQRAASQKDETIDQAAKRLSQEAKFHEDQYSRLTMAQKQAVEQADRPYNEMTAYQKGEIGTKKEEMEYKKKLLGEGTMSDDAVDLAVERIHAGDPRALTNLGRGAQSGVNLTRIQNRLAARAAAEGWSGADLAASQANFTSQAAGARTAAVRSAGIDQAVEEARNTFPLALKASEAVPRGQFVPWTKAVQAVQAGTSSPELARFVAANQAVITAYGQAMSRTGVNTVHAQQAAEGLLSTATSPEAYKAVMAQLELEMQAAKSAPETVRQQILGRIAHPGAQGPAAAPAASPAAGGPTAAPAAGPKEGRTGTFNGEPIIVRNGIPVFVKTGQPVPQ